MPGKKSKRKAKSGAPGPPGKKAKAPSPQQTMQANQQNLQRKKAATKEARRVKELQDTVSNRHGRARTYPENCVFLCMFCAFTQPHMLGCWQIMDNAPYHHARDSPSFSAIKNKSELIETMVNAGVTQVTLRADKALPHQESTPDAQVAIKANSVWLEQTDEEQKKKVYYNSVTEAKTFVAPGGGCEVEAAAQVGAQREHTNRYQQEGRLVPAQRRRQQRGSHCSGRD